MRKENKCYSNVITTTPKMGSKPKSQSSYINMRGFFWPLLIFYPFLVFTYIRNRCTYIPLESGRMVKTYNKMKIFFIIIPHISRVCFGSDSSADSSIHYTQPLTLIWIKIKNSDPFCSSSARYGYRRERREMFSVKNFNARHDWEDSKCWTNTLEIIGNSIDIVVREWEKIKLNFHFHFSHPCHSSSSTVDGIKIFSSC